jgi:aminoglycoside phosphotransferase
MTSGLSLSESEPELFRWASEAVRARGKGVDLMRGESMASRTGRLYRLHVTSDGRRQIYFVKTADPADLEATLALQHLPEVARAFQRTPTTGFADVVAADAGRGWLLTAAVEGVSLHAYRGQALAALDLRQATRVWGTIGRWLHDLHSCLAPRVHTSHAEELVSDITHRLSLWARQDPAHAELASRAIEATSLAGGALGTAHLVVCHGDVTSGNIVIGGERVTLIDFGDLRFDLPALDLSQALMESWEYGRVSSIVPLPFIGRRSERRLREGYGKDWPEGPAWWLPHMLNLAVYLVTLSPNRRASERFRYRRTRRELMRTVQDIERGVHGALTA